MTAEVRTESSTTRRPVLITVAMVLANLTGIVDTGFGILILLSRYRVEDSEVLAVSLLGAGIILFGLLVLAVAGGLGHGSRLSRLLVTIYLIVQLLLHALTVVGTTWDWSAWVGIAADLFILAALWIPQRSRAYFHAFDPLRGAR